MGTVHGVYLKYVGLSALSYAGFAYISKSSDGNRVLLLDVIGVGTRALFGPSVSSAPSMSVWRAIPALLLGYSTVLNAAIALLFKLEYGTEILGKNPKTGHIPRWSYIVFFPFHLPSLLYTHIHLMHGKQTVEREGKKHREVVPLASEVQPGWWVGSWQSHRLNKSWAAVIDLTSEFPETSINSTRAYLNLPTWDGVPASPAKIEEAAEFAIAAMNQGGDILVHCAHGRGRSTTIMCACLVKAGLFSTWLEAFEKGIKPSRPCCKLNKRMRQNLTEWQARYVDGKRNGKGQ